MILKDIRIPGQPGPQQLQIAGGRIVSFTGSAPHHTSPNPHRTGPNPCTAAPCHSDPFTISLPGAIAFPGWVNSHDHLDFNLFPQLRDHIYADYTEWGKDIHDRYSDRINPVLRIPSYLRTRWGIYKNLLNGFTTVVHHGAPLDIGKEELITVIQDCHCLHSLSGERHWKWKLNRWPKATPRPTTVHIGEGTSPKAEKEIDDLRRWNLLKRPIIGIHGITLQEQQASALHALVWCPDSNHFLYDRTADIGRLKTRIPILFGSDSTLTSRWNMRDHLRTARAEGQLNDSELLDALTSTPAGIWRLPSSGRLKEGEQADLVLIDANSMNPTSSNSVPLASPTGPAASDPTDMDTLFRSDIGDIQLIIHHGKIRLFDASLMEQLLAGRLVDRWFSRVILQNKLKYVQGDLPGLMKAIRNYYPDVEFPAGLTPTEN